MEIVGVVVCTSRFVKMKKHLPFCREFRTLYNEDRVVLTVLSNFEQEAALKNSAF